MVRATVDLLPVIVPLDGPAGRTVGGGWGPAFESGSAYAVAARVGRTPVRAIGSGGDRSEPASDARIEPLRLPTMADLRDRRARLADRLDELRVALAQTTFYVTDPESWR
jgi:hypothetical protein